MAKKDAKKADKKVESSVQPKDTKDAKDCKNC